MSTVLVYGATGAQGSAIVRELLARGFSVRVVSRDRQKARPLEVLGAAVFLGNLADRASLEEASRGIDSLLLLLPVGFDRQRGAKMGHNAIDAAKAGGATFIVYNASGPIPANDTGSATADIKRDVAAYLRTSGVAWLVLQPTIYLDNFVQPWAAPAIMRGSLAYPIPPHFKVAWLSWQDNAAYSVAAVSRPELQGRSFLIGGVDELAGPELAAKLGRHLGHEVRFISTGFEQFESSINQLLGPPCGTELGIWYRWVAKQTSSPYIPASGSELGVHAQSADEWIRMQDWNRWRR